MTRSALLPEGTAWIARPAMPRVLLADTDAPTRTLLAHALARAGAETLGVESGPDVWNEAVRAHRAGAPFGAVVMASGLPGGGAAAAVRELAARLGASAPPVVLVFWPGNAAAVAGASAAGAADVLVRPLVLEEAVPRLLRLARQRPDASRVTAR